MNLNNIINHIIKCVHFITLWFIFIILWSLELSRLSCYFFTKHRRSIIIILHPISMPLGCSPLITAFLWENYPWLELTPPWVQELGVTPSRLRPILWWIRWEWAWGHLISDAGISAIVFKSMTGWPTWTPTWEMS